MQFVKLKLFSNNKYHSSDICHNNHFMSYEEKTSLMKHGIIMKHEQIHIRD